MKFDSKHPDKVNPQKLWPDRLMGPHPEVAVSVLIRQSWRTFACIACHQPTSWRVNLGDCHAPACSEECAAQVSS